MIRTHAALIYVACIVLGTPSAMLAQQRILPPLHTSGDQILDAAGHPVRLTSSQL